MNSRFLSYIEEIGEKIKSSIENSEDFLIISSINPDGLSSSALLLDFFYKRGVETHITFMDYISFNKVEEILKNENAYEYNNIIFVDIGSIFTDLLIKFNKDSKRKIYVFDHHFFVSRDVENNNVYNLHPLLFNLDPYKEIATSNIIFYLVSYLNSYNKNLWYLSLVGNLFDFDNMNQEILNQLLDLEILTKEKGVNLPGIFTKPFYKCLSSSFNFFIPNITGSDEKSIELLKNIDTNKGLANILYQDISEDNLRKIISTIIKIKLTRNYHRTEDIIGDIYKINKENGIKDMLELMYYLASLSENNKYYGILYFIKKDLFDILKESESIFRQNYIRLLYDIVESKIKIEEEDGIKKIIIQKKYGNGLYIPLLLNLLIKENILSGKVIVVLYEIDNNFYRGVIKSFRQENRKIINNIIRKLFENNLIYYSSFDNFGGFVVEKSKYEEFIKNLKINLRQENII
ncbi:MAG: hypothetical protein ACP5G1_04195 [Nanopusillaceae archaeon]